MLDLIQAPLISIFINEELDDEVMALVWHNHGCFWSRVIEFANIDRELDVIPKY